MTKATNERLQKAILAVVEQQILAGEPVETGATFARLQAQGYSPDEAKRLIGFVVGAEFFGVLREGRKFDAVGFTERLLALPKMPWEGAEGGE
jgi:hypothetical protein